MNAHTNTCSGARRKRAGAAWSEKRAYTPKEVGGVALLSNEGRRLVAHICRSAGVPQEDVVRKEPPTEDAQKTRLRCMTKLEDDLGVTRALIAQVFGISAPMVTKVMNRAAPGPFYRLQTSLSKRKFPQLQQEADLRGISPNELNARLLMVICEDDMFGLILDDGKSQEKELEEAKPQRPPVKKAFDNYNIAAKELGLPVAGKLTEDRRRKLRARLVEHGLEGWNGALVQIEKSSFLRGENDRGWRASLDFLLQPSSLNKVIEGYYADEKPAPTAPPKGPEMTHVSVACARAYFEREGRPNALSALKRPNPPEWALYVPKEFADEWEGGK